MKLGDYLRHYDSLASEQRLVELPGRREQVLREIGRGKKVLDLGCLGGQFSKLIKDQNNDVYGVELNSRAAAEADKRGIRVKLFDLNDGIPFEDGFFDAVFAGEVLQFLFDTKFLFEECNRVLKPKGILIFTTPNMNSLSNRLRVLAGGYPRHLGAFPEDHAGRHVRIMNLQKIRELCQHTGFRVSNVTGLSMTPRALLTPLVSLAPQLGDFLIVRAQRVDD